MSAYWHYLIEASVSIQIRCNKHIYAKGGTVFPMGSMAEAELFEACKQTYDADDVESLFTITGTDGSDRLRIDWFDFLTYISTLGDLYSSEDHDYFVTLGMSLVDNNPSIAFRLAILKVCLPFEYKRTLFGLWLIVFDAKACERDDKYFSDFFLCALCHDLGLLEVDPQFTRQGHDPRSSKNDVDGYYSHVGHSARFLRRLEGVSEKVIKSIEQHHESMDGTGYPRGQSGNQLAEYGQHIHLFDTLFSIYMKNYRPLGKSLSDLLPIIEINAITHFGQGAVRLVDILKMAQRTPGVFFNKDEFVKIQAETDAMASFIEKSVGVIQVFTSSVGFRHDDKTLFILQNSFIHIALSYYKLRVLHKKAMMSDALAENGDYDSLARALEDNFFTLREIIFHINKFLYRLRIYRSQHEVGLVAEKATEAIETLSALTVKLVR